MTAMAISPRSGRAAFVVIGMLLVVACAGEDASSELPVGGITVPTPTPVTSEAPATTTEPPVETEPPPVATEPPPVATEPTTTTTTTTTTTVPPTTTTEALAVSELLLRGDGLGGALFGAAPEGVIEYVTSILGGNTADTGWVDPFTFAACDGTVARKVSWGTLALFFNDLSTYATERRHFMGWEYGIDGQLGDEPVGLRTPGGTTLGTRVVDLLADFPDASINEGDEDPYIPANFYVSDVFSGLLTGTSPEDLVTTMRGGYGCGE